MAFTNCSSIRTAKPNAADGEYLITPSLYPDRVIKVYCRDMDSASTVNPDINVGHHDNRCR